MSTVKFKYDFERMDNKNVIFQSDKVIIGVSEIDESSVLITDEAKVVKYEVNGRRVLQEWRTEIGSAKCLSSAAIYRDDRYYALTDAHTITTWKNTSMYINDRSKKFKVIKSSLGLIEYIGQIFVIHHDGSLSLFNDSKKSWCHKFAKGLEIISFNQVAKGQSVCDVILIVKDEGQIKVAKYEIRIHDQQVDVTVEAIEDNHSLLKKFEVTKPLKVIFLDELQCVVYGSMKETQTEGIYMLNERSETIKSCLEFDSKSFGNVVQLFRKQDSIFLVTSKEMFEADLSYKSPFLCNLLSEGMDGKDCVDENAMDCETLNEENSFVELCNNLKSWFKSKDITLTSVDLSSPEYDLQDFFVLSGSSLNSVDKVTANEKLAFVPLLFKHSYNLTAKVFVEMISFLLSLDDDTKEKMPALLNQLLESSLPDGMLKCLATMEFAHIKLLIKYLHDELVRDEMDTEKTVEWINMVLDSHHTQIMVSKEWEDIALIKQHVDALCEEVKEDSSKRFMEKVKFNRMQKRSKGRRGCYIEMFEL